MKFMRKALFVIAVLTTVALQARAQTFAPGRPPSPPVPPVPAAAPAPAVAGGQPISVNLQHITVGADTWRRNFWSRDMRFIRGNWFMFGAEQSLPNGWKLIFTQLRSNATCENFGSHRDAFEGDEACYFKIAVESPRGEIRIDVPHIWADMRRVPIILYPSASGFHDILIGQVWYTFSRQAGMYIYDDSRNPPLPSMEDMPESWSSLPFGGAGTAVAWSAGESFSPQNSRQFFFI